MSTDTKDHPGASAPQSPRPRPRVPFNLPSAVADEIENIGRALAQGQISGNGRFTRQCQSLLDALFPGSRSLLTHSCTAALEMAGMLIDLAPGDEVIMPSYTFASTANAFVLRGAVPVFVDIRPDTLNLDETLIEDAITPRTRAIVPVHYAGVGCEMDTILAIAARCGLAVIEDAAQAIYSSYRGRPLGTLGTLGTLSFHETKNVISGEGGALIVNDPGLVERAEIVAEKGTDRSKFMRGQVDKYTWVDLGSSFIPSEIIAAYLFTQLVNGEEITRRRLSLWGRYHAAFADAETAGRVRRPIVPAECSHNAHMYYLLLPSPGARDRVLAALNARGINAVFHYVPLHSAPAGRRFGRTSGDMVRTDDLSARLLRLPLYWGLGEDRQDLVIAEILSAVTAL